MTYVFMSTKGRKLVMHFRRSFQFKNAFFEWIIHMLIYEALSLEALELSCKETRFQISISSPCYYHFVQTPTSITIMHMTKSRSTLLQWPDRSNTTYQLRKIKLTTKHMLYAIFSTIAWDTTSILKVIELVLHCMNSLTNRQILHAKQLEYLLIPP